MDILVSSNLERLLYLASGKDTELVSYLMNQLVTKGVYTVPAQVMDTIRETFDAGLPPTTRRVRLSVLPGRIVVC